MISFKIGRFTINNEETNVTTEPVLWVARDPDGWLVEWRYSRVLLIAAITGLEELISKQEPSES